MATDNKVVMNLYEGVIKYLDEGKYCDLTLKCGGFSIKVHKVVVCSQSAWFENAVKPQFKEGQENLITFENDEIIAVQSLVQYLYSGDYTLCDDYRPRQPDISPFAGGGFGGFGFGRTTPPAPPAANSGFTIPRQPTSPFAPSAPPQFKQPFEGWTSSNSPKLRNKPASIRVPLLCLAHLEVYALADRIGLVQLKMLSEARFSEAASTQWAHPDFYRATAKAYEVAPPSPQGDTLRSSAVTVTALHLREIMANDKDHKFSEMMAENGAFSRDIALRKL